MRVEKTDQRAVRVDLVDAAVERYGRHTLIDTCLALLDGYDEYDRLGVPLVHLGGEHAERLLVRGDVRLRAQDHLPRLWAARALRLVWEDYAEPGVVAALVDEHWRVREMVAKVVREHGLTGAADSLVLLLDDPWPRVRVSALRALAVVGGPDHLPLVAAVRSDDRTVVVARESATRALGLRLAEV